MSTVAATGPFGIGRPSTPVESESSGPQNAARGQAAPDWTSPGPDFIACERRQMAGGEGYRRVRRGDRDVAEIQRAGLVELHGGLAEVRTGRVPARRLTNREVTSLGTNFDGELQLAIGFLQFDHRIADIHADRLIGEARCDIALIIRPAQVIPVPIHATAQLQRTKRATIDLNCRGAGHCLGRMKSQQ